MVEKEERIAIAKMLIGLDNDGSAKLDHFKIYRRQEAILKMAKKRFEAEYGKKWEETTDEFRNAFLKTAETMLDALLEK